MLGYASASNAGTTGVTVTIVSSTKASAEIDLDGPGGTRYRASFELEFHTVQDLSEACLGISADVLDAAEIADVQSRLPGAPDQIIDPDFPVRVTVEPPPACGLLFEDEVDIDLDTPNLVYSAFSPYRLVKAPIGGSFADITAAVISGSVRARGSGGSFSEFVIVKDLNQDYANEALQTYAALDTRLNDAAIAPTAKQTLGVDASVSRAAFDSGDYVEALARLEDLTDHCGVLGGTALPNRWRATRDMVNAEGEVVSLVEHMKFLVGRLNGVP
jgi:hypothetical protein